MTDYRTEVSYTLQRGNSKETEENAPYKKVGQYVPESTNRHLPCKQAISRKDGSEGNFVH